MLKKRALRKIFLTTLTAFILLTVFSIPNMYKEDLIKTNLEIEYITGIGTNSIYLFDKYNNLVKTKIVLDEKNTENKIKQLITNLIMNDNSKFPDSLRAPIPKNTKIQEIFYDERYVTINFSKNLLNDEENLEKIIQSIVYSIMDLGKIDGVIIEVDGETIPGYSKVLDKNIGINHRYSIKSRNDINKVVVYYLEEINGNNYYVPVTKYLNSKEDKIKIIVKELTTSYISEPNLMSFLNSNTELLDYKEQENVMTINFNNAIFDSNNKIMEEVTYLLANSVFDNYDVNELIIQVNGKNLENINIKDVNKYS